ncbi:MAG TPA: YfiR family protein, partial [Steroidobacteraceae bacterium]|nr:YfiR family protein [Steroidobacteraceae bacterium]
TPFVIAVLEAPAVAQELKRLRTGHQIDGRPIEVRELRVPRVVGHPQILYVGAGHTAELRALQGELSGTATLLVTDDEDGLNWGSVLNFVTLDHRVRFEVSLTAAERAHLRISADLLTVAVRVRGGRRQTRDTCLPPGVLDDESGCPISVAHSIERAVRRPMTHAREAPG